MPQFCLSVTPHPGGQSPPTFPLEAAVVGGWFSGRRQECRRSQGLHPGGAPRGMIFSAFLARVEGGFTRLKLRMGPFVGRFWEGLLK